MNKIASLTLTALLLAPLAALLAAEPTLKPGDPAPWLEVNEWTEPLLNEWTEPRLKPGDPAPKLSVSEWVQGKPITKFEKGKATLSSSGQPGAGLAWTAFPI